MASETCGEFGRGATFERAFSDPCTPLGMAEPLPVASLRSETVRWDMHGIVSRLGRQDYRCFGI